MTIYCKIGTLSSTIVVLKEEKLPEKDDIIQGIPLPEFKLIDKKTIDEYGIDDYINYLVYGIPLPKSKKLNNERIDEKYWYDYKVDDFWQDTEGTRFYYLSKY